MNDAQSEQKQAPGSHTAEQTALASMSPVRRRFEPPRSVLTAVAVLLALLAVGLSFWATRLEQRLRDLTSPEVNVPIFDLVGHSLVRSTEEPTPQRLEVPASARFYTLVLPAPDVMPPREGEPRTFYRVEIISEADTVAWRGDGLEPHQWGSFTMMLPSGILSPGKFTLRLLALEPGGARKVEEYDFSVVRINETGSSR
jgi:hypothetical protein